MQAWTDLIHHPDHSEEEHLLIWIVRKLLSTDFAYGKLTERQRYNCLVISAGLDLDADGNI